MPWPKDSKVTFLVFKCFHLFTRIPVETLYGRETSVKYLAQGYNKRTCRLALLAKEPLNAKRQAGKLHVSTMFRSHLV